jgi:hypothetical protein
LDLSSFFLVKKKSAWFIYHIMPNTPHF